jgi:Mg2+-importing ATPase
MNTTFESENIDQLFTNLNSGNNGLDCSLAEKRIKEQKEKLKIESRFKRSLKLLVRQFSNPLMLLLVIAVILAAVLGEISDTVIILFIILASGLLSFWQEMNAGNAIDKLRQLVEVKHDIIREGKECIVNTIEVVPGDIVVLHAGDIIPADCRIIESNELHVNESTLTGESFPAEKNAGILPANTPLNKKYNCLWKSTNVVSGTAKALVINSGDETMFGQISHSLSTTTDTAFEKDIKQFGFFLLKITVVLSIVILVVNLYFHKPLFDSVLFSLAVAIGMAPELLPAIMTFAMSAGAKRMMEKKVIVKKLSAIFNFGQVNVLCTDKTGTITSGIVKIKDIVNVEGISNDLVKLYTYINSSMQGGFSNPIDDAIIELKLDKNDFVKLDEVPYDFIRKRLSILVKQNNKNIIITKGALKNVLDACNTYQDKENNSQVLDDEQRKNIEKFFVDYSETGYRVLGICYKNIDKQKITRDDETEMTFLGFILLEDPLKENVLDSIERLEKMNVSIKIITGDNRYAAMHTAKKLGLNAAEILTGEEMNNMSPGALIANVLGITVFAEIEPYQKERIIRALQKSNNIVAYIGDGINDVAAIHAADTGISTNNAVDVAKEAADFVLLEKDLSVLADGIYEGRKSFINSMKYIFINTGSTFGNMFSVAGASLLLPFLPMLPKQILLTNFITDFPFLSVSSDNVDEEELNKPIKWDIKLIRKFMIVFGLHSSIFDFVTFYALYYHFKLKDSEFQTGWFLESVFTQLLILFIIRTKKTLIKSKPGKFLIITSLVAFAFTIWLPISPFANALGFKIAHSAEIAIIAGILIAYIITADILKIWFFKSLRIKE